MQTAPVQKASLHPALWIAAIAVTLFSLVGIGAMTGLLSFDKNTTEAVAPSVAEPAPTPVPLVQTPAPEAPPAATKPVSKPVAQKPAAKPASSYSSKPKSSETASADVYRSDAAKPAPCVNCATIASITPITEKGEGSGLGAIAGGVVGAIVGNQIGKGSGKDVARIAGIAGGAYAGHQIEKSQRAHTAYDIVVRFEDGSTQHFRENAEPVWRVGDKVRVENGTLQPR